MTNLLKNNDAERCGIGKSYTFVTVTRRQTFNNMTLDYPLVDASAYAETNGFSLFRPFPTGTAGQIKWEKCRLIAAMLTSINLLNRLQGLTCIPVDEPKLYYTDTSFDASGRVSQFSLGGRGLTYFLLTYYLPFPIFRNSIN